MRLAINALIRIIGILVRDIYDEPLLFLASHTYENSCILRFLVIHLSIGIIFIYNFRKIYILSYLCTCERRER